MVKNLVLLLMDVSYPLGFSIVLMYRRSKVAGRSINDGNTNCTEP